MTDLVSQSVDVLGMLLASGGKELIDRAAKATADDVTAKAGHIYGRLRGRVGEQPNETTLRQALAVALQERKVTEADLVDLLTAYRKDLAGSVQMNTHIGEMNANQIVTSSVVHGSVNMGSGRPADG